MNTRQQKFVTEYLQWGIPCLAYANAYNKPNPNGRAIESAANRLLRNPEVQQAIHDAEDRIRHQVEREIADRQALDVFTIEQKRHLLKQIATGDILVEQRYKTGDCRHCTQFIRPTINQMLRAIDLDNRMAAHYPPQQIKIPPLKEVPCEHRAEDVHSRSTDNTTPEQHFATTDNKTENTNHETRLPLKGIGGQPAPDTREQQPNTTTATNNTSPHPGDLGLPGRFVRTGVHSRSTDNTTPEEQHFTTTDNKTENTNHETRLPFRGIGGQPMPDTREQQPNTTTATDNTSPRPRDLPCPSQPKVGIGGGVITHDELMELLYPKEEKLQHFTTTGLKKE